MFLFHCVRNTQVTDNLGVNGFIIIIIIIIITSIIIKIILIIVTSILPTLLFPDLNSASQN